MNNNIKTILIAVISIFCLWRLFYIDADFPRIYTDGGFVETDEGWYCNWATAKILTGKWLGEGFQSMPVMPVNHVIQYVAMSIFGVSIYTARYTAALFFFALLASIYFTNRKMFGGGPALISIVPIACSSFLFAYSRIALIDIEMLAFVSLSFLAASYKKTVLSSVVMAVAILTKTSAVCFIVPLAIMLFLCDNKKVLYGIIVCVSTPAVFFLISYLMNADAVQGFFKSNASSRAGNGFSTVMHNALRFDAASIIIASAVSVWAIKDKWIKVFSSMVFFAVAMIACNTYQPMRYFTLLYIPLSMIIAAGVKNMDFKKYAVVVLVASVILNIGTIFGIMNNLTFNMANEIKNFKCESVSGRMANTVTLWTKIPSIKNGKCVVGNR
jgi:4-amino-4-deoxy-L-arabinose transferase-like glycosyltransferase